MHLASTAASVMTVLHWAVVLVHFVVLLLNRCSASVDGTDWGYLNILQVVVGIKKACYFKWGCACGVNSLH